MNVIALASPVGGAGRTTMTAELASLLVLRGHTVLAVECDPGNMLGLHFGLGMPAVSGLASHGAGRSSSAWAEAGLRSDDGVLFVPWGAEGSDETALSPGPSPALRERGGDALTRRLLDDPQWLRGLLAQLALPANAIVLVDSPPWPSVHARQALTAADLALLVAPPTPQACAALPALRQALTDRDTGFAFVATRVQPARPLHADVLALLRATMGDAMLPYLVHADTGLPDALARGESFCRSTPHSQAAHDLHGIAAWLSHWATQRAHTARGRRGGDR
ncbi:cellulose synthase operon protein YhjQ [Cupriavidus gilardii J11]|uniref:Cellulose synthase operon protein YhjQ n=1 Tax=Cupriavidus gilardii J11 TaxID=936133 RepID=A0A562BNI0_9BURK|nr:cellulose biosynthesis protein BcsQ [Cupriavidus gilardii]TWG86737.1 cellulose synthase operon protein YhjQ [Cupriavidus gilardii J11]